VNIPFLLCPSIKLVCRGFYLCAPLVCTPLARERVEITRDDAATRGAARRTHATRETGSGSSGGTAAGSGRFSTPPPPPSPLGRPGRCHPADKRGRFCDCKRFVCTSGFRSAVISALFARSQLERPRSIARRVAKVFTMLFISGRPRSPSDSMMA